MTISNGKMNARNFDNIQNILESLSLTQSFVKGRKGPICRNGNWGVNLQYTMHRDAQCSRYSDLYFIFSTNS